MPVFVELTTDAFEEVLNSQANRRTVSGRSARSTKRIARRPTRGLEIKEDTPAAIKVILSDGTELPLVDSSSPDGTSSSGYTNFILQRVTEARMEKHQIVETFGASYIFFFGENPRFLDVQAILVNSHDFNWEAEWWENYEQNFRGTRLVEKGGRLYMFYDDNIVEGYMLMCQADKVSEQPHLIQMSFRLFLTNYRNISFIGSPLFPIHSGVIVTEGADISNGNQNLTGLPLDQSLTGGSAERGDLLARTQRSGTPGVAPRLSDVIRSTQSTGSISPDTQLAIEQLGGVAAAGRTAPIRGLIADNLDEYTGLSINQIAGGGAVSSGTFTSNPQSAISPAERGQLETDDLHKDAVTELGSHGADIDSPEAFSGLGLQPSFSTGAGTGATFKPQAKGGFSFDAGAEVVGGVSAGSTSRFRADPLGAIFGGSPKDESVKDNRFDDGVGDVEYGFHSDFSSGPGFGEAGFGDFGGPGFGSGQGASGDPGFKDPSKFSFSGVAQNQAAFDRFRKPRPDQTTFGSGAGIGSSSSGLSGGATVRINGKPSSFSLISLPGSLKL